MKTPKRSVLIRTRQTRKARAVVIRSGATEQEMRRMSDLHKRGAAAASPAATTPRLRLRSRAKGQSVVPPGQADREANVLRRGRARLSVREKGRPTPGADRKTSLE